MNEDGRPEVHYVGTNDALGMVVTQMAILTGWMLVWRQYRHAGWKLVAVRVEEKP